MLWNCFPTSNHLLFWTFHWFEHLLSARVYHALRDTPVKAEPSTELTCPARPWPTSCLHSTLLMDLAERLIWVCFSESGTHHLSL